MVFMTPSRAKEKEGDLSHAYDLSDPFRTPAVQAISS